MPAELRIYLTHARLVALALEQVSPAARGMVEKARPEVYADSAGAGDRDHPTDGLTVRFWLGAEGEAPQMAKTGPACAPCGLCGAPATHDDPYGGDMVCKPCLDAMPKLRGQ